MIFFVLSTGSGQVRPLRSRCFFIMRHPLLTCYLVDRDIDMSRNAFQKLSNMTGVDVFVIEFTEDPGQVFWVYCKKQTTGCLRIVKEVCDLERQIIYI